MFKYLNVHSRLAWRLVIVLQFKLDTVMSFLDEDILRHQIHKIGI